MWKRERIKIREEQFPIVIVLFNVSDIDIHSFATLELLTQVGLLSQINLLIRK